MPPPPIFLLPSTHTHKHKANRQTIFLFYIFLKGNITKSIITHGQIYAYEAHSREDFFFFSFFLEVCDAVRTPSSSTTTRRPVFTWMDGLLFFIFSPSLCLLVVADSTERPFVTGVLPPSLTAKRKKQAQYVCSFQPPYRSFFSCDQGVGRFLFCFFLPFERSKADEEWSIIFGKTKRNHHKLMISSSLAISYHRWPSLFDCCVPFKFEKKKHKYRQS